MKGADGRVLYVGKADSLRGRVRSYFGSKAALDARLALLTEREREVMARVVEGRPNKAIAQDLDISVKTVEVHRAKVMEKLGADSVAELVQLMLQRK